MGHVWKTRNLIICNGKNCKDQRKDKESTVTTSIS